MTYESMIALLREGGVDTETFDRHGAKRLWDLYHEILEDDVLLRILPNGRVCRIAMTVKILIRISKTAELIRQVKRVYPSGKEVIRNGSASISETRKRGEPIEETVIRGMREECGIAIDVSQMRYPTLHDHFFMLEYGFDDLLQSIDTHESTVYPGILTKSSVDLFFVDLLHRPWPEETRIIDDNGVKIHLAYRHLENPAHLDRMLRALP